MAILKNIHLPDFGRALDQPDFPASEYQARCEQAVERMRRAGFDALVVYADREHTATMAHLTGFDPRFEEALLLLGCDGRRRLVVGNECMSYLPDPTVVQDVTLFQEFSLMGQPRDRSRDLRSILDEFGIRRGTRVGCVDWKYYDRELVGEPATAMNLPAYMVDLLRDLCGGRPQVLNATALFMHPQDGLRIVNCTAQLAQFEFAGSVASSGVLAWIRHLRPGIRERELERHLDGFGLPRSMHATTGFGCKAARGLASPGNQPLEIGQPYTAALGVWGALTARAGMLARRAEDIPAQVRAYYQDYAWNYFDVVATWYQSVRVGVRCCEVVAAVEAKRDRKLWSFALNPGHYLHLDEWVHSPFTADSAVALASGMALQSDIIPIGHGPDLVCANLEDGILLADAAERERLAEGYPDCWRRIVQRRRFMQDELGISLDESVLPTSNIPAWLPPFALDPEMVLTAG